MVALVITAVGMALVLGTILLFAGLIGLLVRLTAGPEESVSQATAEDPAERELKVRAAAAAVAAVLAQQTDRHDSLPQPFPLPPAVLVSTWQAVQRANLMGRRRTVR